MATAGCHGREPCGHVRSRPCLAPSCYGPSGLSALAKALRRCSHGEEGEVSLRADTRRVVVGVDGSEDSKLALRWAVEYAGSLGGEVEAVAAPEIKMTAALTDSPTGEDYLRDASERLDKAIAEVVGDATTVPAKRTVTGDRAARALVEVARGADVLVIGSSGQGELPGMHIGSTTNYCVHHAPCPVMVLRNQVL